MPGMNKENMGHPMMVSLRDRTKEFALSARTYIRRRIIVTIVELAMIAFMLTYTRLNMVCIPAILSIILVALFQSIRSGITIGRTKISEIEDMIYGEEYAALDLNYERVARLNNRINHGIGEITVSLDWIPCEIVINVILTILTSAIYYFMTMS